MVLLIAPAVRGQSAEAPVAPDRFETARLVWTTLIAVDHANRTGNYSVLRDLAAPGFQRANDPARLATIFARIREAKLGLGRVVLATPVYTETPEVLESGLYRVTGQFPARPAGIDFEMLFQQVEGQWRLYGIAIVPLAAAKAPATEGAAPAPVPKPAASGG
jgi:hypothetical protein